MGSSVLRHAAVTLTWEKGKVRPIDDLLARDDVSVHAIRNVSPGPEGRHVELLELRGELDGARTSLADSPAVLEYDVTGTGRLGIAYVQCRTAGLVGDLLATLHDHGIVLDWPIHPLVGDEHGLELTAFGTSRAIQRAAAALPEGVDLELERIGEYEPGRPSGTLTARQLELLDLAVREGYYEVPRRTTHRELAATLGLSTGTVSERLQRIESTLVAAYVGST